VTYSFEMLKEYAGSVVHEETHEIRLRRGLANITLREHRFRLGEKEDGPSRFIVSPFMVGNMDYGNTLSLDGFGSFSHLDLQESANGLISEYLERKGYAKVLHECRNGVPEIYVLVDSEAKE
jgi:hypothetical protein